MKFFLKDIHPLSLQLSLLVVVSIVLMFADRYQWSYLEIARAHLLALVYPVQYLVDLPVRAGQWLSLTASSHLQLINERNQLQAENTQLQVTLQKFAALKNENARLRQLLGSARKTGEKTQIAEVLAVELDSLDPSKRKILIDKGEQDKVCLNQPVIDAYGVVGQVTRLGPISSVVTLITDPSHELPVQVVRTGLRSVAKGGGVVNRLSLLYLSNTGLNMGIKIGDLIVTSGSGGNFPKDYPVGTVVEINPDIGTPHAQVQAIPRSALERNREVLLLWTEEQMKTTTCEQSKTAPLIP
jgi:rod shape-determining protein MreC